jgi:hypothetical protein
VVRQDRFDRERTKERRERPAMDYPQDGAFAGDLELEIVSRGDAELPAHLHRQRDLPLTGDARVSDHS